MQPNVERVIANAHRSGASPGDIARELEAIADPGTMNLDLLNTEIEHLPSEPAKVTMADLARILNSPNLMPEGWTASPEGWNHWRVTNPEGQWWIVTTDRAAFEYAPDRLKWWGPGSPSFP